MKGMRVVWIYFLAAALSLLAGLLPLFRGEEANFVFVVVSGLWVILGIAFMKKTSAARRNER